MRTRAKRWTLLGAVLAAGGSAFLVLRAPAKETRAFETVRVSRGEVGAAVKATGIVKARVGAEVKVGSRASGVVERLNVRVGDEVAAGRVLARLETRELEAQREGRRAALATGEAERAFAAADLERKRSLAAQGLLPAAERDVAEKAFAVAAARESEARAALEAVVTQLGYATIRAPISGVVASVATQEGETVAASLAAPTFVTLVDLSRLELWAYVDETDIGRVHAGQEVTFTVDTYPGVAFPGTVATIYPKAEIRDNVVDYVAVVRFEPPAGRVLRPEMTATVRIAVETKRDVLVLPRRAVRRDGPRTYVLVAGARGEPGRRVVATGAGDESVWEIREGLREGDEVLVGDEPAKEGEEK